jgi:hypothetical protein
MRDLSTNLRTGAAVIVVIRDFRTGLWSGAVIFVIRDFRTDLRSGTAVIFLIGDFRTDLWSGTAVIFLVGDFRPDLRTGTAVTFFFTCIMDLFLAEAFRLRLWRKMDRGVDTWRVLTFPSGFLGECDLKLFVSLLGDLVGLLFVWRGEDAEGNRDAGVKVQVGDLLAAQGSSPRSTFRYHLMIRKVEQEDSSCSSFYDLKEKKGEVEEKRGSLLLYLDSFRQSRGWSKQDGDFGWKVVCWLGGKLWEEKKVSELAEGSIGWVGWGMK